MNVALIQMNPTVGALQRNTDLILEKARLSDADGARLIVFPELTISGYPPEDLILKDHFCADCEKQIERLKMELPRESYVVVGSPVVRNGQRFNAALVFYGGGIIGEYHKMLLPNYGVFDEKRLFEPGTEPFVFNLAGTTAAIHICEDSWYSDDMAVESLKSRNIDLLINLSASPYHRGKLSGRIDVLAQTARKLKTTMLYCNLVGGQDELVFDGASMVFAPDGSRIARAKQFQEDLLSIDIPQASNLPRIAGGSPAPRKVHLNACLSRILPYVFSNPKQLINITNNVVITFFLPKLTILMQGLIYGMSRIGFPRMQNGFQLVAG